LKIEKKEKKNTVISQILITFVSPAIIIVEESDASLQDRI